METTTFEFNYSKTGNLTSVNVRFTPEPEDDIRINRNFIDEISKYVDISEDDHQELFYIIARAIQLKSENVGRVRGTVRRYDFTAFAERFVLRLMDLMRYVSVEVIADYFCDEAKVEDLDIFLNRKDVFDLACHFHDGSF